MVLQGAYGRWFDQCHAPARLGNPAMSGKASGACQRATGNPPDGRALPGHRQTFSATAAPRSSPPFKRKLAPLFTPIGFPTRAAKNLFLVAAFTGTYRPRAANPPQKKKWKKTLFFFFFLGPPFFFSRKGPFLWVRFDQTADGR